jgi:hypothetical protein
MFTVVLKRSFHISWRLGLFFIVSNSFGLVFPKLLQRWKNRTKTPLNYKNQAQSPGKVEKTLQNYSKHRWQGQ